MRIFEIAVTFVPTNIVAAAEEAKILVPPKPVLAKDEREAQIKAARLIPVEYDNRLDQVQVAVRPF